MEHGLQQNERDLQQIKNEDVELFMKNSYLQQNLKKFLKNRFHNNISVLKEYFPEIAVYFDKYTPTQPMDFFCSENGIPNLFLPRAQRILYENSDPIRFVKKHMEHLLKNSNLNTLKCDSINDPYGQIHCKYCNRIYTLLNEEKNSKPNIVDYDSIPVLIFSGIGLGYELSYFFENFYIHNLVLIVSDNDLFHASLQAFDWKNLLTYCFSNNIKISIILEQDIPNLFSLFSVFFEKNGKFLEATNFVYLFNHDHNTNEIVKQVKIYFNYGVSGFFDDSMFAMSHCIESIVNDKKFLLNKRMPDNYLNYPVFVIGSGPSLDKDISFLRSFQDKAIIIACGTAFDALYHAGIKPDFYAVTERIPEVLQAISAVSDEEIFSNTTLLCTDVVHPAVIHKFKHTAIFAKLDENFLLYLRSKFQIPDLLYITRIAPFVGNMGISGALTLGFKKIYLFGIDCGKKTDENNIHSVFTTLYHNKGADDSDGNYRISTTVPGNFGGQCCTNHLYMQSISNISQSIKVFKRNTTDIICYNCSDGALIDNTISVHSYNLKDEFLQLQNINKKDFLENLEKNNTTTINLSKNDINSVLAKETFHKLCDVISHKLDNNFNSRIECIRRMQEISEFIATFSREYTKFFPYLINNSLQQFFSIISSSLFQHDINNSYIDKVKYAFETIKDFLLEAPEIYSHQPDYIMGEHRKHYHNGKVGKNMPHCKAPNLPEVKNIITKDYDDPLKKFVKRYE